MLQQGVPQAGPRLRIGLRRGGGLRQNGKEGQGVALGPEVNVQLGCGLIDFLDRELARPYPLEEYPAGILFILLRLLVELGQVAPVGPLSLDLLLELLQHVQQGPFRNGLQEVAVHANADGLPGVLKVVVPGDDDRFHLRELPADQLTEGQAIHEGHPDIGNQHVRLHLADKGQGHLPVPGLPGKGIAILGPGDGVPQGLPDDALVFYQKYAQHDGPPSVPPPCAAPAVLFRIP